MGFFRELPNLLYQSPLSSRTAADEYVEIKNLFRRVKLREDLQNVFTVFDKYEIVEGARPDTVAEEIYGNSELDWVVLITAGIVNVRDEWPLSNYELYQYAEQKYGEQLNDIRYYETKEIRDSKNRLILPAGKVVDSDFVLKYYDNGNVSVSGTNVRSAISNWEYETIENNKKSSIYLLRRGYLQQFLNDMRDIMTYQRSSQYVDSRMIKTENTRNTIL
jgi:hypothetical protein